MREYSYQKPTKLSSLSVVLPAYNEAQNIEKVIKDARRAAQTVTDNYEIIIVNDGSRDNTAEIVQSLAKDDPAHIKLINNPHNLGYGPTVKRGLMSGKKDWVFFTDADGQFDMQEISKLVRFSDDYDFIVGRRKHRQDPFNRKLNAHIFKLAVRIFFGVKVKDIDCAFKLMRRNKLQKLNLISESAMINAELLHKAKKSKVSIKEVDVTHLPRKFGNPTGANRAVVIRAVREFYMLRYKFLREPKALLRFNSHIVFYLATISGIAVTVWSYHHGVILAFGDAEAHINIAKRVVSGLTPGLAQLGGVWLPLPHLLMAPFTAINYLWRTGLAGSIVSVSAFIWLCVIAYRLAYELTSNFVASYLAPLALILNPNLLYIASTPMTETLLLSMVTSAVYYFTKWVKYNQISSFIAMSFFTAAATLSRYDGWPVACLLLVIVPLVVLRRTHSIRATEAVTLAFGYVGFFGIAMWLLWNKLIFGSALYFSNSVYGSKQQQMFFLNKGYLPTYHNFVLSVEYFAENMRLVAGLPILILACIGLLYYVYRSIRKKHYEGIAIVLLTLTPIAFYVVSLYIGQASLILPAFSKAGAAYTLSNVRYGVQILLAVALFIAYLGSRFRKLIPVLALIIMAQAYLFVTSNNVIVYTDATRGLSSQSVSKGPDAPPIEAYMRAHYKNGLVLMDDYRNPIGLIESGIPMNDFIGSGNKPYWQESLNDPDKYAEWIIVQKASTDYVWTHIKDKAILNDHYAMVFNSGNIYVYHRIVDSHSFVVKSGQHLELDGKPFVFKGVNSYDLLSQSNANIDSTLNNVSQSGFNSVRLWCFNKQGGMTQGDFAKLDYIVSAAQDRNLKLICVLGNTLSDYGGISNFGASNPNQFFTDEQVIRRYESYVTSVVSHVSIIDHQPLSANPTIAAWELINEPRIEGVNNSSTIAAWVEQVGANLLTSDPNHLLSPGTEGFMVSALGSEYNQEHGSDINDVCNLDVVSLCSVHLYPKYISSGQPNSAEVNSIIQQWRKEGNKINKPVFIGEVGYDMSSVGASQPLRVQFITDVANAIRNNKLDGALVWNVGNKADSSYTLQYGDPASEQVLYAWNTGLSK